MYVQVMFFSSAVFLFMFLLTCCSSGGVVCAEKVNSVSEPSSVELFKKGETRVSESGGVASSFSAHSLVDVNGLMVALAAANSNCESDDESCCSIGIWSKPLKYEKGKLPPEVIKPNGGDQRMAQAAVTKKTNENYCTQLSGPSAVVKDNKIYILLRNDTTPKNSEGDGSNALLWDLELVVGTVATPTNGSPNTITWDPSKSLKDTLQNLPADGGSRDKLRVIIGKGIVMGGSTILFPLALQNINLEGNGGCTVIYSEDDGKNWNFPSKNVIDKDCRHATLLEWEGKLLMITTSSSSRTREVYVSADKGKTWTEYTEADSNLLINFLKRAHVDDIYDVVPATISGRNVTLLTQRRSIPSSGGSESRHQVHLLMTDNKKITSMGSIHQDADIAPVCKLLLTKENDGLFALCDKGRRDSPESVVLLSLTKQLKRISPVLEFWESADEQVSNICIYATNGAPCSNPMPTSGLVGFLSDTDDSTQWSDGYFGVSARVTGGTNVGNGFKLSGAGASIEWEVGNDPPTPRYSFAYRGLTLVATVTIHDIPKSDTPLMRVGFASKAVGLWYGKENHWKGLSGEEGGVTTGTWEKDKPYQVVITVVNGTGSVYIDGKRLGSLEPNFRPNEDGKAPQPRGVSHELKEEVRLICFGGCVSVHDVDVNTAASHFTVRNVFLYNRVLSDTELLPPPPPPPQQQDQSQSTAEKTIEKTITGNSTVEEPADESPQQEKDQSQSTTEEKKEATITGSLTVEEQTDTTPQQEKDQSQSTAEKTIEKTITGNSTVEERTDTTPAGNDSSVHESLSSLFQLFALLAFLGSASL